MVKHNLKCYAKMLTTEGDINIGKIDFQAKKYYQKYESFI